jgi:DNA-binding beta-propeller fold protein YncE
VDGSGNVYFADSGNGRLLKETPAAGGYIQSTIASGGKFIGVAADNAGNVYISDASNNTVLKETLSGGAYTQSTIGSGLSNPFGLAVDGIGNVYIADEQNSRVLRETPSGGSYIQTTIGSGLFSRLVWRRMGLATFISRTHSITGFSRCKWVS